MMAVRPENRRNVPEVETWCGVAATKASVRRKTNSSIGRNNAYSVRFHRPSRRTSAWFQTTILSRFGRARSDRNRARVAVGLG